ncbi:GtrA family protein [Paenibacillus doosanensis]|uniref:GtrA family protein n=1 Tax=Paenibacillus doosanensis TaxID=1229154 RepID=UPI00217FFD74|nr:GtrA family protein [Paenibacillus doosanensis]MCS7461588.1 GtrA family protein [Paenibacillus doosanensis]
MNKPYVRFLKFSAVGAMNSLIDLAVFTVLTYFQMYYLAAQCISFLCGVLNSYAFNRSWTFQRTGRIDRREFLKFLTLNTAVLLLTSGVLSFLYAQLDLPLLVSKLGSAAAGVCINFAGSRLWVFRLSQDRSGP